MKKAMIVVGDHYAGKSKTIGYVKLRLGIGKRDQSFSIDGQIGRVFSQSFEEANKNVQQSVELYVRLHVDLLILACRPASEDGSRLEELKSALKNVGHEVETVDVVAGEPDSYYEAKADEILSGLTEVKKASAASA